MKNYQFNKTAMLRIEKDLAVRIKALPVLEAKETALRLEIKKMSDGIVHLEQELQKLLRHYATMLRLWSEMPDIVSIKKIKMSERLVAGINVPTIKEIVFDEKEYNPFQLPAWIPGGIELLKDIILKKAIIHIQKEVFEQMEIVRRKTTQKVNLYEKVQIPDFEEAIRKIKRFLEDEENLSISSQKMLKNRFELVSSA